MQEIAAMLNFLINRHCSPMCKLRLAQILKEKGITKYRFALMLKKPPYSVFRYFRKGYDPKLSTLSQWAKVLGVSVSDLIKETNGNGKKD